jgi:hypothetical protein
MDHQMALAQRLLGNPPAETMTHIALAVLATIAAQRHEPNGGLAVMPDTFTTLHRAKITALANQ